MARFRMRNDARTWFKQIADFEHFKTDFDQYYFCLMAGFASGRSTETGTTSEMVENFVEDYKEASRFLIGLLVVAELKKAGKMYLQGKDYIVADGDILNIRFKV